MNAAAPISDPVTAERFRVFVKRVLLKLQVTHDHALIVEGSRLLDELGDVPVPKIDIRELRQAVEAVPDRPPYVPSHAGRNVLPRENDRD